ncbi:MAG: cell division ATP-binding protein FtsE [Pseudomonadota bacterium]
MIVEFDKVGLIYGETGDAARLDATSDEAVTTDGHAALQDVSFSLEEGEFRFLTGPSGAGKTSLLKLMYLALRPTRGRLTLFDQDVAGLARHELPPLRRRIGVVFQEFRLLDHLSAFENVALPMKVAGVNHNQYREDVSELLNWVGLGDRMGALPPTLSGGEKQRVALARALVAKPELILADEPTGNVDPVMAERIMKLIVELNKLGSAVIVATHDLDLVRRLNKPTLSLKQGRLHAVTPGAEPQGLRDDEAPGRMRMTGVEEVAGGVDETDRDAGISR